jgi:hypothetical protein
MAFIGRTVTVRFTREGWHCWPEADGVRDYLASRHRHLFYYEVTISVNHNDREVEFHDLLEFARESAVQGELGRRSCEDMAEVVLEAISQKWKDRQYKVSVFEDNEVGATITWEGM